MKLLHNMTHTKTLKLTVSKVNELLFIGDVVLVSAPGADGECTILPNHEPFITLLKKGTITAHDGVKAHVFQIEKGILETTGAQVTILV